jgi:hypothetical protein
MPNSSSKVSQDIHDQYYTSLKDAEWCLTFLQDEVGWGLKGTALEPCVGTGSFVKASENLKLKLSWKTNDFFPDPSFSPDTQQDIRTLQPETKPDFIITNPPFGKSNSLARGSLKHCLTICDRVAMILPKGARRLGFMDCQPDFAHLVADVDVPEMVYDLPTGEQRTVSTCLQVWEVKKTKRKKIRDGLDIRTNFVSWWCASKPNFADNGDGPADFQVCRWGGVKMNTIRDKVAQSGGWISVRVNDEGSIEEAKEIIASVDMMDYLEKSTSVAAFDPLVWLGRVNSAAVAAGRLSELARG